MTMRPNQKVGIDSATIARIVATKSKSEYWRTALTMPIHRPRITATENALIIRMSVAGTRSVITSRTRRPSR